MSTKTIIIMIMCCKTLFLIVSAPCHCLPFKFKPTPKGQTMSRNEIDNIFVFGHFVIYINFVDLDKKKFFSWSSVLLF